MRDLATWSRWLHIYLSMFSFIIVLFFSVTGLTLNHVDWFPESTVVSELKGSVKAGCVSVADTDKIPKLEIVEQLLQLTRHRREASIMPDLRP